MRRFNIVGTFKERKKYLIEKLIYKIWRKETKPWQVLVLCPIYKKGDVMDCLL